MTDPHSGAGLHSDSEGADVLFLAGEHSGDQHAARAAADLQRLRPHWRMAAVGGPALAAQNVRLLYDLTRDSVVGLVEVLRHYKHFRSLFQAIVSWIARHQPKLVVLVDYPGFNLRLADALRKRGLSRKGGGPTAVYQYISPQIWAWKAGRRFTMARNLDELGVIFPFECQSYADTQLPVHFVGHPFVRKGIINPLRYDASGPLLLLPGSRKQAVQRIFPTQLAALRELRRHGLTRPAVCLYPDEAIAAELRTILQQYPAQIPSLSLTKVETGTTASAVLTSSGTMSLNCALAGIPGAIVYRAHPLTAWIGRRLINVPYLGIANLVLKDDLYPEFIQGQARAEMLARELTDCLQEPTRRSRFQSAARRLEQILSSEHGQTVAQRLVAVAES